MKIVYTKHALKKFKHLSVIKLGIKKRTIEEVLDNPEFLKEDITGEVIEAVKVIDEKHSLRVIYKELNGIIVIITFHPAQKGRYEKE